MFELRVWITPDGVPGWGNKPEDFVKALMAGEGIGHYIHKIEVVVPVKPLSLDEPEKHLSELAGDSGRCPVLRKMVSVLGDKEIMESL
jgi:hypothetical protein